MPLKMFITALLLALSTQLSLAADDIPDFSGVWIASGGGQAGGAMGGGMRGAQGGGGMQGGGGGRGARMRPQVTAEAQRMMDDYDLLVDDPAFVCSPSSIWRAWANPTPSEIEQLADRVIIRNEYMDVVRTVYLDGRDHDANAAPNVVGNSIGHYEGSTLVIDTVGFTPSVIHTSMGIPQTGTLHTIERLTLSDNGQTFQFELRNEDPATLTAPWTSTRTYRRAPEFELLPFDCVLEDAGYETE